MNKKLKNIKLFGLIAGMFILLSCNIKETGIGFKNENGLYCFENDVILYDIVYDHPETHTIKKDGVIIKNLT
jgi:hypothetical protein